MVDPRQKSKARSNGRSGKRKSLLKNFTLYIDESFDCREVTAQLDATGIKYKLYSEKFSRGEDDAPILRLAGEKGYALLTCDNRNRYREAERAAVLYYKVRQFVFSGNLSGVQRAHLLVRIKNDLRQFCRDHERPFVATITESGKIALRMDKNGNVYGRKKEK